MAAQPTGTVTLVFTDVEGSTELLRELGSDAYRHALAEHRSTVRAAFGRFGGYEVDYEGDAFFYAFASASAAVSAATEAICALEPGRVRVRVGIHTGEPSPDPPKYVGLDVHKAARIMAAAHGGQVVVSASTRALLEPELPSLDLGEHRLKDFPAPERLFQLGDRRFPPLRTLSTTNLPRPVSDFVGRDREKAELLAIVREGARLVTLTGPGGSGKTRLALEVAGDLVPEFGGGIFWVGLATVADAALVPAAVAQALGGAAPLVDQIGRRSMLLLLDNFEHVVGAAPELATLLRECPGLRLLVTSRETLQIEGERRYGVPPLAEDEAVALFCARATSVPDGQIRELCRRLDNLPLALELAAARTAALTPAQIVQRLGQRLDLLKGGRDAEPRQQTLRATIEWSYELLTDQEQRLFARLAAFVGGCSLDAAEAVASADIEALQSLVEKSLVRFDGGRYWMLETIRAYASERLAASAAEADDIRARHASWYAALAEAGEDGIHRDEGGWLPRLAQDAANFRAALEWAHDHDDVLLLRLAGALGVFWFLRAELDEAARWLGPALALAGTDLAACAKIVPSVAMVHLWRGETEPAGELLNRLLPHADRLEPRYRADLLHVAGVHRAVTGDFRAAAELYARSACVSREIGDLWLLLQTLSSLGDVALNLDDLDSAQARFEEVLALAPPTDSDATGVIAAIANLGLLAVERGAWADARARYRDALNRVRGADFREAGVTSSILLGVAQMALETGDAAGACRIAGAAAAFLERIGMTLPSPTERRVDAAVRERLRTELDETEREELSAAGRRLDLDAALALAQELLAASNAPRPAAA